MTGKEFLNAVARSEADVLQLLLNTLGRLGIDYCVIGGLAVNAYAEPVVSLDLDVVIAAQDIDKACEALAADFTIRRFERSINLSSPKSQLRIQLQTDPYCQDFIHNATLREVLGYSMKVASPEDVLRGKTRAYLDEQRRPSKRQKDLADILRLIEAHPGLRDQLPPALREKLRQDTC